MGKLWIGGAAFDIDVVTPDGDTPPAQRPMSFKDIDKGAYAPSEPITAFYFHDKGAEGSAEQTYKYLKKVGFGVHGSIDSDGSFTQYADFSYVRTLHAGRVNDYSIGIEMTNTLIPNLKERKFLETWDNFLARFNAKKRPIIVRDYRGLRQKVYGHFPAQIATAVKIANVTCQALRIPRRILMNAKLGLPWGGLLPNLKVNPANKKKLIGEIADEYKHGVFGHFNVTNGHGDPGTDIFEAMIADGFEAKEVVV